MSSKFDSICSKLIQEAYNSPLQFRLAACMLLNGKIISHPKSNASSNYSRGHFCGSIHAEAHAMVTHFGNLINYDHKHGWRFQRIQEKPKKKI